MPIERQFLGFDRPSLHLTADYLLGRYQTGQTADMSPALVVVSGGRAERRLLEILVQRAEDRQLLLNPPQIETVGQIPEHLYRPQRPFATDLVQQLAWAHALKNADRDQLKHLITNPPQDDSRWTDYGQLLGRLHTELAADGLDFDDVIGGGEQLDLFSERERWRTLHGLQQAYLNLLDELQLWDKQTARLVAVEKNECRTDRDLVLVGTVDMTVTLRKMLDQVAEHVTALVFARADWEDRFDPYGCLVPSAWQDVEIQLADEQVHVVEGSPEQADQVARCLADLDGRYRGDQISIGLPDESVTPLVKRQLAQCSIACRAAAGEPLSDSAPIRLIAAVESYLRTGGYPEFAALVRHPDVFEYVNRRKVTPSWLEELDAYYNEHLQVRIGGRWLGGKRSQSVRKVYETVERCLTGFRGEPKPLTGWAEAVRNLLTSIYGHRAWNRDKPSDRAVIRALQQVQDRLTEHAESIPAVLMPILSAADALRLLLEQLQSAALPPPADPTAIELLGWLELPLDDAPAAIVCNLNEGFVPSSVNSDLFLPDALRKRLGVTDNRRRYARDAYALSAVLATREQTELIVARRNADGDPLIPSRLLLAADRETIARRAKQFFTPPTPVHGLPPLAGSLITSRFEATFAIPKPHKLNEPIDVLRVTAFRDYLACKYRFYLRHVLHLQPADDAAEELDGGTFGTLLHEVVGEFGMGTYRDSTDADEIRAALNNSLDSQVKEAFGDQPLATVGVQIEQLRQRLNAFAEAQANWAMQGWQIEMTEAPPRDQPGSEFEVDGKSILLRGRIDRIDVNRETGERMILDYKSSDSGKKPDAVHRRSGQWIDLQLPLYRHLAQSLGLEGPLGLGYILLPKSIDNTRFEIADWTVEDLEEADEVARQVIRGIRAEDFWPPTDPPPDFSEDLAPICLDSVQDKPAMS